MPIKVTYTDAKGDPMEDESSAPITNEDRVQWNKMRYEGFKRGIYEDDLDEPKGEKLMKDFDIDPKKVPAIRKDMIEKASAQSVTGALPEVEPGYSSEYLHTDPKILAEAKTPRMGYVTYVAQRGDKPSVDYQTDINKFLADQQEAQKGLADEWAGFGDPTKDVNYKAPGTQSGFGGSPGLSSTNTTTVPDTRFPTRDPLTGRVTAAAQPAVALQTTPEEETN